MLLLEQLYTDNTNDSDDDNNDDNDTWQTDHDCIGSLACMPNEPKTSKKEFVFLSVSLLSGFIVIKGKKKFTGLKGLMFTGVWSSFNELAWLVNLNNQTKQRIKRKQQRKKLSNKTIKWKQNILWLESNFLKFTFPVV